MQVPKKNEFYIGGICYPLPKPGNPGQFYGRCVKVAKFIDLINTEMNEE